MKNNIILLKTLLRSTSLHNTFKYTKDKKKKRKVVGNYIGLILIYAMLMVYSIAMCVGYGLVGIIDAAPAMCAVVISTMAFFFTVFKTNGYLFNFKEYDMLMSLPFKASTVAGCKFLYMYVKALPWYISISLAMMIGYGFFAAPSLLSYPVWIILTFFLPIIPMLFASLIGFFIAKVSSRFKATKFIRTVLTFAFVILCFTLRYIIEAVFKDDKVEDTLEDISAKVDTAGGIYLPIRWFTDAVTRTSIISTILFIVSTVILFAVVFHLVGKSYNQINSALKSQATKKNYKMTSQKKRNVVNAVAFKEFKRMVGSPPYLVNAGIGEIMAVLLGIVTLIMGFDRIVAIVTQNAPFDSSILQPAIPFIAFFLVGMVATTACSPSLEGKNYWIVQSLPIEKTTLYQGKMLFNMYLTVPFMVFATICMCISAKVPVLDTIMYLILAVALCAYSSAWGCVCGIKHMRLDWENEIEVIKQGAAVAVYMLPNMFVVMGLTALVIYLGTFMNHVLIALIFILISLLLAFLSYLRVISLAKKA
ncbi:MAG: hypothetical protein K6A69_02545 [Lachnospiraceae bacterium]|nr:hypothetical protein [Lachnospiraceae bacterium]